MLLFVIFPRRKKKTAFAVNSVPSGYVFEDVYVVDI